MAEAFYCTVAPHNPMGPLATVINVHLAACIPNFLILEYIPDDLPIRKDLLRAGLSPATAEQHVATVPAGLGEHAQVRGIADDQGRHVAHRHRSLGGGPVPVLGQQLRHAAQAGPGRGDQVPLLPRQHVG